MGRVRMARSSSAVAVAGATISLLGYVWESPLLAVGLTGVIVGAIGMGSAAVVAAFSAAAQRPSSYDRAFDAGYELGEARGFADGRRSTRPTVVPLSTACEHCGETTKIQATRKSA